MREKTTKETVAGIYIVVHIARKSWICPCSVSDDTSQESFYLTTTTVVGSYLTKNRIIYSRVCPWSQKTFNATSFSSNRLTSIKEHMCYKKSTKLNNVSVRLDQRCTTCGFR